MPFSFMGENVRRSTVKSYIHTGLQNYASLIDYLHLEGSLKQASQQKQPSSTA